MQPLNLQPQLLDLFIVRGLNALEIPPVGAYELLLDLLEQPDLAREAEVVHVRAGRRALNLFLRILPQPF